jgi:hypothetical protein
MQTREETIVELTRTLKALGYNIKEMKFSHIGEIDAPAFTEIELKITRQK